MMWNWSSLHSLESYSLAPAKSGIYHVGFYIGEAESLHEVEEDKFFGENYPKDFEPHYIGISKSSIRRRLYCHAKKRGSRRIKKIIEDGNLGLLKFTYTETTDVSAEHLFLTLTRGLFDWNIKRTEGKNLSNYLDFIVKDIPELPEEYDFYDG